mmetsp:Transcript_48940/g.78009  ORF Transcript_48940/g.78009 Transcript_48940/m.78009 type:complete len:112 (-) Transcript_48940:104-439(-)
MAFYRSALVFLFIASPLAIVDARAVNILRVHSTPKAADEDTNRYAEAWGSKLIGQVDDVMEDIEAERGVQPEPDDIGTHVAIEQPVHLAAKKTNEKKKGGVYNFVTGEYSA